VRILSFSTTLYSIFMASYLYKKIRGKREPDSHPDPQDGVEGGVSDGAHVSEEEQMAALQEKRARRVYRWRIMAGLFMPATIEALNTTMIAGALPFIGSDFSKWQRPGLLSFAVLWK
jgi:hypothetical protein